MRVRAWVSDDGVSCRILEYAGSRGLLAWWRNLPGIVGVKVFFKDGTKHNMESSEWYGLRACGCLGRARFWNGQRRSDAPPNFLLRPGIEIPDELYERASLELRSA